MKENISIPYLKIYPNYLVQYYERSSLRMHSRLSDYYEANKNQYKENFEDNSAEGMLSRKASKSLKLAINWLNFLSKNQKVYCAELSKDVNFKLNFLTLNLPVYQVKYIELSDGQRIPPERSEQYWKYVNEGSAYAVLNYSDEYCKHDLLNHFLTLLRRDFKCHNYIWRAETQKNGNIHFHITTNKFLYAKDVRDAWNRVLSKTDMLDKYQTKFCNLTYSEYKQYRYKSGKSKEKELQKAYKFGCETNWLSPNTTDIHAVWKIKNIAAYLCEYITKNNSNRRLLSGFLWRSSMLLAKLKGARELVTNAVDDELRYLIKTAKNKIIQTDFATIFCFDIKNIKNIFGNSKIVEKFSLYRQKIFDGYINQNHLLLTS